LSLKGSSSGSVGLLDFLTTIEAMQEMMQIGIEVRLAMPSKVGRQSLFATAIATSRKEGPEEGTVLASVSAPLRENTYQSLDVALFRLLYTLDGKLAENELEKTKSG